MVMTTSKPIAPVRPADMTREEAETVTQQIKENFDSLGNMLLAARDRKAYKSLGYRSFESYCQSEFGKSSSTAYQAIEDAKIRSQLEARISENYGEEVTLKFPSSHLKPLKAVEDLDDKLKVIEYAQKLATAEGKKPTKQHLEIAVFEIAGKRSEDFKNAIQKLGFTKGVKVETMSPLKKDRGVVTNIDKAGLIYVEHYYGHTKSIPYRATELRILTNEEKPTNPLEGSVAAKGDRVLIFAEGLQGKQGTIYTWKEGKTTLVMVDGQNSLTVVAYAEMELVKTAQPKNADWESELVWESGKNTYYYFPQEDKIYSNKWPTGLTLEPYTHSGSPIEFMENWENRFSNEVLESLATPAKLKTLVLAQAIELPEEEGKEFVADLITSLNQLFSQTSKPPNAMGNNTDTLLVTENQQLREQLAEAEAVIQLILERAYTSVRLPSLEAVIQGRVGDGEIARPGETAAHTDSPVENNSETSTPGETVAHSDFLVENIPEIASPVATADEWKSVLISNNFSRNYHYTDDCTEKYRGWTIYLDPNGGYSYIDLNHPEKGAYCCDTHFLGFELEEENEIIKWAKGIINQVEDFCPGQLTFNLEIEASAIHSELSPELASQINRVRDKFFNLIEGYEKSKKAATKKKEIDNLNENIETLQKRLENLDKFEQLRIGNTICHHRRVTVLGKITGLEFSQGEMPIVFVKYFKDGELEKTATSELSRMISVVEV